MPKFASHSASLPRQRRYARRMRRYARLDRPQRRPQTARLVRQPAVVSRSIARSEATVAYLERSPIALPAPSQAESQPNPYVDYGVSLTREGGILIAYKDLDLRFRHTLWRIFAWTAFTGPEGWLLLHHSPVHAPWINIACLLAVAIVNGIIVAKPVELYRTIEIRPDCLILEGSEIFWRHKMEAEWPAFRLDAERDLVLCGIYSTRFVEYLTVRRFDELDRAPEVFAAHLQEAIQRLWNTLHI
jgi:hypothetical protein